MATTETTAKPAKVRLAPKNAVSLKQKPFRPWPKSVLPTVASPTLAAAEKHVNAADVVQAVNATAAMPASAAIAVARRLAAAGMHANAADAAQAANATAVMHASAANAARNRHC